MEFKPCPAYDAVIANAIVAAQKILSRIDSHWPKRENDRAP
jgi:transposase